MNNANNSFLSLPPEEPNRKWRPSESGDERADLRVPGAPASGRIVLLAVVMLSAVGAGGLLLMYNNVHGDDAKNLGAPEQQAASPVETSVALAPLPPLQSALPSMAAPTLAPAPVGPAPTVAAASLAPASAAPASARPPLVVVPVRPPPAAVPLRTQVHTTPVVHHVRTRPIDTPSPVDSPAREPAQEAALAITGESVTMYRKLTTVPAAADSNPVDDTPAKPAATGDDLFDSRK